jgi:hypothetical protein
VPELAARGALRRRRAVRHRVVPQEDLARMRLADPAGGGRRRQQQHTIAFILCPSRFLDRW